MLTPDECSTPTPPTPAVWVRPVGPLAPGLAVRCATAWLNRWSIRGPAPVQHEGSGR